MALEGPRQVDEVTEDADFQKLYLVFQRKYQERDPEWFRSHVRNVEFNLDPVIRGYKLGDDEPELKVTEPVNLSESRLRKIETDAETDQVLAGAFCLHDPTTGRFFLIPEYLEPGYENGFIWELRPYEINTFDSHDAWAQAGYPIVKPAELTQVSEGMFNLEKGKVGEI